MRARRKLEDVESLFHEAKAQLDQIHGALVVRDLDTARSMEAYEGLRRTVVAAGSARRAHLAQLATIARAIERGASVETLADRVNEWCGQAGLARWDDPERTEFFEVLDGSGPVLEVVTPAWVDMAIADQPRLVSAGQARRIDSPQESIDMAAETAPSDGPPVNVRFRGDET